MSMRKSHRLMVLALTVAGLSGCHASPLVAPSALSPVSSQAYLPPSGGHTPSSGPNYGPKPYNPAPTTGPGHWTPNTGRPTGGTGTPKCYPHMPCL